MCVRRRREVAIRLVDGVIWCADFLLLSSRLFSGLSIFPSWIGNVNGDKFECFLSEDTQNAKGQGDLRFCATEPRIETSQKFSFRYIVSSMYCAMIEPFIASNRSVECSRKWIPDVSSESIRGRCSLVDIELLIASTVRPRHSFQVSRRVTRI